MGDPYLSSDESLILSTQGIRIDSASLDLMLTSRRLILIDNSVNPFQLRTLPLETIITVFAGRDVEGDPIITLSHMDPTGTGAPIPVDFIFTRQKGEPRIKECNEWAATLDDQASRARNDALSAGTLPYDPVKVIQPRMSATYRIETFSPHRPEAGEYPARAEPAPSPVIPESLAGNSIPAGIDGPAPQADAERVDFSPLVQFSPMDPEETGMPGTEISGAGEFLNTPGVAGALTESSDSPLPETEIADEVFPAPGSPTDLTAVLPATDTCREENLPPATQATASDEIPVENNETPVITDAQKIWANAARSIVSSPPMVPAVLVQDKIPVIETSDYVFKSGTDLVSTIPDELVKSKSEVIHSPDSLITEPAAYVKPLVLPLSKPTPKTAPDAPITPAAYIPSRPETHMGPSSPAGIAAIVIIVLVILGVAIVGPLHLLDSKNNLPPVEVPIVTDQPTPTPIPTIVPADGVYVRVEYPGTYIGEVGNTELMRPVSGTGVQIYKILWNDRVVSASAQKQDYSGDTLTVELYNNGVLIKRSSTRVPMGSADLLIDPITGNPPGIKRGDIP